MLRDWIAEAVRTGNAVAHPDRLREMLVVTIRDAEATLCATMDCGHPYACRKDDFDPEEPDGHGYPCVACEMQHAAVEGERLACAKLAELIGDRDIATRWVGNDIAAAIRARRATST